MPRISRLLRADAVHVCVAMSSRGRKLALGLAIAPGAMVLVILHGLLSTKAGRFIVVDSILFSYVASIVFGIPICLIWQRRGWTSWLAYMGGAFVMGTIATPAVGFQYVLWRTHSLAAVLSVASHPELYADCTAFGVIAMPIGLLFWFIIRPDRP